MSRCSSASYSFGAVDGVFLCLHGVSDSVHLDVESRLSADFLGALMPTVVGCRGPGGAGVTKRVTPR